MPRLMGFPPQATDEELEQRPGRRSPWGNDRPNEQVNMAKVERKAPERGQKHRPTGNLATDGYSLHARRPHTEASRPGEIMSLEEAAREESYNDEFGPYGVTYLED